MYFFDRGASLFTLIGLAGIRNQAFNNRFDCIERVRGFVMFVNNNLPDYTLFGSEKTMKTYLVGGAVRDQLLGYPIKERDWVVVGGTADSLLKQGYQQVGRDFPVFLHPQTHEEYALARTERKSGVGYYGFHCDFNPNVSLEDDLGRRDLTINAMAMDERGNIIDPHGGLLDLQNKRLRHVSPSFIEDPVRVLRVARFAARYHHLGFHLADETRRLMYTMVRCGELAHLVPERVWQEWQRSLEEPNPHVFIEVLRSCDALRVVLPEINALFGVPSRCDYHPEVDTGVHTLMVLQEAVKRSPDPIIRCAALLHDLGKAMTPIREWPEHHEHGIRGLGVINTLAQRLRLPAEYRQFALLVSRFHISLYKLGSLTPEAIVTLLEEADAFRRPARFEALLLTCEADVAGRKGNWTFSNAITWRNLAAECAKLTAKPIIEAGFQGELIKSRLHALRVEQVRRELNER